MIRQPAQEEEADTRYIRFVEGREDGIKSSYFETFSPTLLANLDITGQHGLSHRNDSMPISYDLERSETRVEIEADRMSRHSFYPPCLSRSLSDVMLSGTVSQNNMAQPRSVSMTSSSQLSFSRRDFERPVASATTCGRNVSAMVQYPEQVLSSSFMGNEDHRERYSHSYPYLSETPGPRFNQGTETRSLSSIRSPESTDAILTPRQGHPNVSLTKPIPRADNPSHLSSHVSYPVFQHEFYQAGEILSPQERIHQQQLEILALRRQLNAYERVQSYLDEILEHQSTKQVNVEPRFFFPTKDTTTSKDKKGSLKEFALTKWRQKVIQLLFQHEVCQEESARFSCALQQQKETASFLEEKMNCLARDLSEADLLISSLKGENANLNERVKELEKEVERERRESMAVKVQAENECKVVLSKCTTFLARKTMSLHENVMDRFTVLESRIGYAMERLELAQALVMTKNKQLLSQARQSRLCQSEINQLRQDRRLLLERLAKVEWPSESSHKQTQTVDSPTSPPSNVSQDGIVNQEPEYRGSSNSSQAPKPKYTGNHIMQKQ